MDRLFHPFPPVYDENSRVLILGTFPSPMSRKNQFFYGHPQNRFWKALSIIVNTDLPVTVDEKKSLLLSNGIALWDVLHSCLIESADDSSIKEPVCNDFSEILKKSDIRAVFTNGKKAESLYRSLALAKTGISSICLPSTSPANRRLSLGELVRAWSIISVYLNIQGN